MDHQVGPWKKVVLHGLASWSMVETSPHVGWLDCHINFAQWKLHQNLNNLDFWVLNFEFLEGGGSYITLILVGIWACWNPPKTNIKIVNLGLLFFEVTMNQIIIIIYEFPQRWTNPWVRSLCEKAIITNLLACHVLEPLLKVRLNFWDFFVPLLKLW